jgi:hypothetical protein
MTGWCGAEIEWQKQSLNFIIMPHVRLLLPLHRAAAAAGMPRSRRTPTLTPYLASRAPQHRPPMPEPKTGTASKRQAAASQMAGSSLQHVLLAAASADWLSLPMMTTSVSYDRASPVTLLGNPTSVSMVLTALQRLVLLAELLGLTRVVSELLALGLLALCLAFAP